MSYSSPVEQNDAIISARLNDAVVVVKLNE